jgi:lysozyme family protein
MFQKAVERVVSVEGGYSDHEADRGGSTKFGITQQTLAQFRGVPVSDDDVRDLTEEEAHRIYKKFYWDVMNLDSVKSEKIAEVLFDQAVNRGVVPVVKYMQQVLGLKADGKVGIVTITALNSAPEQLTCLLLIEKAQIEYVRIVERNPSQIVFLEGWIRRTHSLFDVVFRS